MTTGQHLNESELDRALLAWGQAEPDTLAGDRGAVARIVSHATAIATSRRPAATTTSHRRWWLGGAVAMAASVAIALLATGGWPMLTTSTNNVSSMQASDADDDEIFAFALLYTPTSEEEYLL